MARGSAIGLSVVLVLSMVAGPSVVATPATGEPPAVAGDGETDVGTASARVPVATGGTAAGTGGAVFPQTSTETDMENQPPSATFTVTPDEPAPDETVGFDAAESSDADGEVVSHVWQVDGERIASGPTTEYVFEESGTHEVRLTVTDDRNGTASLTKLVTVAREDEEGAERITDVSEPEPVPEFTTEKRDRGAVIPFLSGSVVLESGIDDDVLDLEGQRIFTVVQFRRQPSAEELDFLQSLGYEEKAVLSDNTYYAGIPPENAEEIIELEYVRAIADVEPEWKVVPELDERVTETDESEFRVTVLSFEAIPERADSLGLERVRERTYRGELSAAQIGDLRTDQRVKWIEPFDEPRPLLEESVGVVGAQRVAYPGIDGTGVRVGVVDTGIEHGHPHFSGVNIVDSYDKNDDDTFPEADNYGSDGNDHGTHVAGTIAGSSFVDGKPLVGVAPNATLVVARGLGEDQFDRVNSEGTDIISNSWGSGNFHGRYTSDDKYTDRWARDNPQSLIVAANGNNNGSNPREQYANTPGLAKNSLAVGSIRDGSTGADRVNNIHQDNNMSQPNDGRQKPDINAPGAVINSSILNSTYGVKSGTSMATPHVSGIAALYEEHYSNRNPDADEFKAGVVATAGPVENPVPSERAEGYGAVNAYNVLFNNSYESNVVNYDGNLKPPSPNANEHTFNVSGDAEKVVVSLSWVDAPGSPSTTDTLVNDLDLYVGPTNDPKRYSVTDRDRSINRKVVDDLSSGETGTEWKVTVEPHNMWTGAKAADPNNGPARQEYDGRIRVVTEKPELSISAPDRIVVEPQASVTESFEVGVDATGAPVHGIRAFVDSDSRLGDCSGTRAHDTEHVIGILSEDYLSGSWDERLCFDVPDEAGTYPVTTTVNYTSPTGQTATIEKETVVEVAKPRVELDPYERNVSVGEKADYELVVGNVSGGVGAYEVNISLNRPRIGTFTDFSVEGGPTSDTIRFEPSPNPDWVTITADGMDTFNDYGTATIGRLEAEGVNVGKSPISVDVDVLEDEAGDTYSLRSQGIGPLDPSVPSDGLLNVTRGFSQPEVSIPPPDEGDGGLVTVGTPITISINQSRLVTNYDAEAQAVEWDFGDDTTGTGLVTEQTYDEPGTYEITAAVQLTDGRTVELSHPVTVESDSDDGDDTSAIEATRTIDSTTVPAGESTEVTVTVETAESSDDLRLIEEFESSLVASVVDDDGATISGASDTQLTASWGGVSSATVTYEVTVPEDAADGETFDLTGTVEDREAGTEATVGGDTTIEVGDPNPVAEYANDEGVVEASGLLGAAADFRTGEIDATVLLEVAAAFRTKSPVA